MLLKYIQHFLTDAGIRYFPEWFAKVRELQAQQSGFVTSHYHIDEANQEVHFFMYFADQTGLDAWAASPEHLAVLDDLKEYWRQAYQAKLVNL